MNNSICIYFESYYVGGLDTFTINLINNWPRQEPIHLLCNKSHSGASFLEDRIKNPCCVVEIHDMSMMQDWAQRVNNSALRRIVSAFSRFIHIPYYILYGYRKLKLGRFSHLHVINGGYPACLSSRCVAISWWLYTRKKSIHNFHNYAVQENLHKRESAFEECAENPAQQSGAQAPANGLTHVARNGTA